MTTAEQIKAARAKLGLSTRGLGLALGMSGRTVEEWEQGRSKPSGAVLKLLDMLLQQSSPQAPEQ